MNIRELLRNYKNIVADIALKEIKLEMLKTQLNHAGTVEIFDEAETIEGMVLRSPKISSQPIAINNSSKSSTEDAALNYHKETIYKNEYDVLQIKSDIRLLTKSITRCKQNKNVITALINGLNYKEKYVVECMYIDAMDEKECTKSFVHKFGYGSRATTMRIEENAMDKMQKIYKENSADTDLIQI